MPSQGSSTQDLDLRAVIRARLLKIRQQLDEMKDHRRSTRRSFAAAQRIAPYAKTLPDRSTFHEVMCRDISTSGFSFSANERPEFKELIVELGAAPNYIYVVANIVRVLQQPDKTFVIGCEFIGRHT